MCQWKSESFLKSYLYGCFKTSVLPNRFVIEFVNLQKGDCFTPILFHRIINALIQSLKREQYKQFGFKFIGIDLPMMWLLNQDLEKKMKSTWLRYVDGAHGLTWLFEYTNAALLDSEVLFDTVMKRIDAHK